MTATASHTIKSSGNNRTEGVCQELNDCHDVMSLLGVSRWHTTAVTALSPPSALRGQRGGSHRHGLLTALQNVFN